MNAVQAYARAKLLASTPEIATVCEQFEHIAAGNAGTPPTPAAHRVLAEKAPTPQSRAMHGAMAALLAQVCPEDAPLCLAHVAMWAQITRHFIGSGVRQASMQFAMETEALVAALAEQTTLNDYENRIAVLQQEIQACAAYWQSIVTAESSAHAKTRAVLYSIYARAVASEDGDDFNKEICEEAKAKRAHWS
jgi:hypothetical protein